MTASRTQHPRQLGNVTLRIVDQLDRQRGRRPRGAKPRATPSPETRRKAAFADPRQMRLPTDTPYIKDQVNDDD